MLSRSIKRGAQTFSLRSQLKSGPCAEANIRCLVLLRCIYTLISGKAVVENRFVGIINGILRFGTSEKIVKSDSSCTHVLIYIFFN